jgi:2-dehydro-3-deoxygluconokinase
VTPEIVTLGEVLVGLVANGSAPLPDIVRFGRHIVGAEANVAVGLARLGHSVGIVGRVGADGFGTAIVRRLRAEGVDVTGLSVDPSAPTGILVRECRSIGGSEVLYHRRGSAGGRLDPSDLEAMADVVRRARWLHLTGITPALSDTARAAAERALELARDGDATVSLDINLRRKLWTDEEAGAVLWSLASRVDVVIGGPDELAVVAGGTDPHERLLSAGVRTVVVKMGAAGAAIHEHTGTSLVVPALAVARVVDPVGAGDAFCAGYIAARLEGRDDQAALRRANACAAAVISVAGDLDGLPSPSDVERLVADANLVTLR